MWMNPGPVSMNLLLFVSILIHLIFFTKLSSTLNNGLARTPPMGWNTYERFRCTTDCKRYPDDCINENLIRKTAYYMVKDGYRDVGYTYVNLDDCWMTKNRTEDGRLMEDRERFPSGLKALGDYVHSLGLKFGIYENYGRSTCAGYAGVFGLSQLKEAAQLFYSWGVDYVKLDACTIEDVFELPAVYAKFGELLNRTGRPMVYSCSYPAYYMNKSAPIDFRQLANICNLWRNNIMDIDDAYESMTNITDLWAIKDNWPCYAGPGQWNDADFLIIGDYALSKVQCQVQMAIWAIIASPLIMSAKLWTIGPEFRAILQNREVIAVNQDPLGLQGSQVWQNASIHCWTRKIQPIVDHCYSYAVCCVSRRFDGTPFPFEVKLQYLGLNNRAGYQFRDLFPDQQKARNEFVLRPQDTLHIAIPPTGNTTEARNFYCSVVVDDGDFSSSQASNICDLNCCRMFKATALKGGKCCEYALPVTCNFCGRNSRTCDYAHSSKCDYMRYDSC